MQAKLLTSILLLWLGGSVASGCNIPVFRYALERWKPDPVEIVVLGENGKPDQPFLNRLTKASVENDAKANAKVVLADPFQTSDHKKLWKDLVENAAVAGKNAPTLPHLVARTEIKGKRVNNWSGDLMAAEKANLLDSPARKELRSRLLGGDSIVWLLIKSKDKAKNNAARDLLTTECKQLENSLELPEGIGLPGSELFADTPLLLRFTVLEVDAIDSKESYLVNLFSGFHPKALEDGVPLIAPVFGRGRALEVIPADEMNSTLISDLTQFLCGACSCKVKGLNPGFDLLIEADWDNELFGPDGERPNDTSGDATPLPTLITIPPGRKP